MRSLKTVGFIAALLLVSVLFFQQVTVNASKSSNSQQSTNTQQPASASVPAIDNQPPAPTAQKDQKEQAQPEVDKTKKVLDLGSMACPPRGDENCRQKETEPTQDDKGKQDH